MPSANTLTTSEKDKLLIAQEPSVVSWNGDTTPKASEDVSVTLRSQQGGEGVGVAHVSHGQARECKDVVPHLMAQSRPNGHGGGSARLSLRHI